MPSPKTKAEALAAVIRDMAEAYGVPIRLVCQTLLKSEDWHVTYSTGHVLNKTYDRVIAVKYAEDSSDPV